MQELIVFVDENGRSTGEVGEKLTSHNASTLLHLAFSCYVFDDRGRFLVTQRAHTKKVWPGVWSNSVCGHPGPGEEIIAAIKRRLDYELGMKARSFQVIVPDYIYKTPPFNGVIEHEFCPIYVARADSKPNPKQEEVANYRWMKWEDYIKTAENDKENEWSWWCKDQLKLIKEHPVIMQYAKPS